MRFFEIFYTFSIDIFKMFPPAFLLVGLFMVWVKRETVEKHFGNSSGYKGHLFALLLASTTVYPFVVVLPMAGALYKKGGSLGVILTYLGGTAICRVPMTIFEATYLGVKFTLIRYLIGLPLVVLSSIIRERFMRSDIKENRILISDGQE